MERILDEIDVRHLVMRVIEYLPHVVAALFVALLLVGFYRLSRPALHRVLRRAHFHEALIALLVDNIFFYAVILIALIMAAEQLGVNITAALAGLGIAGVAVGLAAQDSVANMIAGILIFWDKPFVVGDWVKAGDDFGQVAEITLRSTRIRTPRNTYVVIPNKKIIDDVLENYSKHGAVRVDVAVGIAYKEQIVAAREALLAALSPFEQILREPAPDVVVEELGSSSVNLKVRVWINDGADFQRTFFSVTESCKTALDAAGIQIPFPHLQLFVEDIRRQVLEEVATLGAVRSGLTRRDP